jgi:dihydrofolate reductase
MKISIIVAMDDKRGLGRNNQMVWNIPGELKRFKEITTSHPIIMGRKTFESIGRVLPGRLNIIITRNLDYKIEGAIVVASIEEAIEKALLLTEGKQAEEIFIIGGGQIFKEALEKNLVDKLYLTLIEGDYNADAFFPDYSNFTKIISEEKGESGEYKYKFLTFEK